LTRLTTDVTAKAPALITLDGAVNDVSFGSIGSRLYGFFPATEALIRRTITENPGSAVYAWIFTYPPNYSLTPSRSDARDLWVALANHYGVHLLRWDEYVESLLPTPYTDAEAEAYFLGVHPTDLGHAAAGALAQAHVLPLQIPPQTLPARYYAESEDYEATPIIRTGNNNDGESGTWAGTAPARTSNTANSTISWTGTFCSFGLDTNYGASAGVMAWSVDGGAFTNFTLTTSGGPICVISNFVRGAHTVTIKVVAGLVTINRFMAI
jgi:hypothetical protein